MPLLTESGVPPVNPLLRPDTGQLIPLKLNIRNFLSYRENVPTLDFAGVHVACLCGDNGHGKSALLDAITWCLWGQARGQVQDDLVSHGAEEARVELEFLARNKPFRVIRSRSRAGGRRRQGASDLQLQALSDQDDGNAQVISGNTIRETQDKIEQLVGMDYATFINSAFLLQGRADEFTNKTPADRKAVLAAILGLDAYDRYQGQARERMSEKRAEADRLAGGFAQLQREMDEIGDPSGELAGVNGQLADLNIQLTEGRREADALRERVSLLEHQTAELTERTGLLRQAERDIAQLEASRLASARRIEEYQRLIGQAPEIKAGVEQLEQTRQRFAELEDTRRRSDALRQEKNALTQAIGIRQARLEADIDQARRRVEQELTPKAQGETALTAAQEAARQSLEQLAETEAEISTRRSRLQVLAVGIGEATTLAERYRNEGGQLKEKLHLLENSDPEAAFCPLCQTPLSQDGCQRLSETYQEEIEEKRALYVSNSRNLKELEKEKGELEKDLTRQEQVLLRDGNQIRDRMAHLERQIQESRQAQEELALAQPRLSAAVAALESGDFAQAEQEQLREIEGRIVALAYAEDDYQQCYRRIQELQPYAELEGQLNQAAARLPEEEEALTQAGDMLSRRQGELAEHAEQLRLGEAAVSQLPGAQAQLQKSASALAALETQQQAALGRKGLLEGRLSRLEYLREELKQSRERLSVLQEEQGLYQELVNAFGRQGVQAMLIETVVPRLEEEANLILGRMTDNRMHVKLETQRERRSRPGGDPIETLEINVSDELGQRSYEMYSGGEAFRVNLALRIALSKVLSQRTGAPLPTLFIDEGFGTQDTAGRERILDVISAIENDFDKIIIITHLDDLKDMFPVRIEVRKDGNGSTFWLS